MNERISDVPAHQSGFTSSVGGLWPPEPGSFARIRGFYPGEIGSDSDLRSLRSTYGALDTTRRSRPYDNTISRVQIRALMDGEYLRSAVKTNLFIRQNLEAIIPLESGGFRSSEPVLVYLGQNSPGRQPNVLDRRQIAENLAIARREPQKTIAEIFSKAAINGYNIEILPSNPSSSDVGNLARLYQKFGWNREDVEAIIDSPNNLLGVARLDGQIVSAGVAEVASIPLGRSSGGITDNFRIAEITEAATLGEHERRGLYTAVSARLLQELAAQSRNDRLLGSRGIDLVYGECNGLSAGVLCVARSQGREFSTDVCPQYGFRDRGVLIQAVPIDGSPRRTQYNDLVPTFLTRSKLEQYYG